MIFAQLVHVQAPTGPAFPFLVLFLVVVAGPLIIERFKVPGIIGLLLGGLLIGPNVLGLVGSGNTTVPDLGQIGLLYLMFVAGLELDLRLVSANRRATIVYSLLTFSLPMLFGTIAGLAIGFSTSAALLLGSLLASHTLVVYPMIRDMGRGDDPAVATGVGATVITDTLTLMVLAAIAGVTLGKSGGLDIASQLVTGLVSLGVGCFVVLPRVTRLFLAHFGTARAARYVFALVAMLTAATLAEVFGIEGIVGAFFAGLALNRLVPNEGDLMERIEFFGGAVFVPIFLVSVGMIINPAVMADPETLRLAAIFMLACFGGKALAAVATKPLLGYRWPEVGILFSLTVPQAAATLAATIVGYDIGLFGTNVVNAVLVLIAVSLVVSATLAPIFTRRLARSVAVPGRLGRRVLLVMDADHALRRGVAELALRLAASDDGVVIPVVLAVDDAAPVEEAAPRDVELMLVGMGIDRPVEVFVDVSAAASVRHATRSFRSTAVVVDDADSSLHDALQHDPVGQPVLFVGDLAATPITRAAVASSSADVLALHDVAGRLARTEAVDPDDESCNLVVQAAGVAPPELGQREVTFVRVLSADEDTTRPHETLEPTHEPTPEPETVRPEPRPGPDSTPAEPVRAEPRLEAPPSAAEGSGDGPPLQ
jgi:Kef-type K+ transport system membrane component KefB